MGSSGSPLKLRTGFKRVAPDGVSANKAEAIAIQSEEVYDRYMKYLTGCAELFRDGYTDLCQFTLEKGLMRDSQPV
jgi:hypothetical protein